jgi:hypothetical protein
VAVFALVSRKGIPNLSANFWKYNIQTEGRNEGWVRCLDWSSKESGHLCYFLLDFLLFHQVRFVAY